MGFLFFFHVLLEQLLKFLLNSLPSLLTSRRDDPILSASNTEANSAAWGHLNSAIPHKNFTHTAGNH